MSSAAPTGRKRLDDRTEEVIARVVAAAPPPSPDQMARLRQLLPPVPIPAPADETDAA